jgi:4-hydroxy 2-oxovalerate aldolase
MKLLDCTLRDGGYTNKWNFSKEQVRENYTACVSSNIEYCEIGFVRTKPDPDFGPWYHTTEKLISDTLGDLVVPERTKIVTMAQMGTFSLSDFVPKKDSIVSMVRVLIAYHCKDKNDADLDIELIYETANTCKQLKEMGYEVTVNVGRIDKMSDEQIVEVCKIMSAGCEDLDYLYVADTYGNLGMVKVKQILELLKNNYSGKIGFHAHDNLLNATVKSIDAWYNGADIVDGTIGGLGRGSGNAKTELLIAHMLMKKDLRYGLFPVLEYGEKWIGTYKKNHVLYFITGMYSMHVNYAIELIETYDLPFSRCYEILIKIAEENKHHFFDAKLLKQLCAV